MYTYATTLRIDYTFGVMAGLNFIYFFIDDITKVYYCGNAIK